MNFVFTLIVKFNAIDENLIVSFFSRLKKMISSTKKIFVFVVSTLIMILKKFERLKKTISSTKKIFVCIVSFSIMKLTKIKRAMRKIIEFWRLMNDQFKYSFKLKNVINRLIIVWETTISCETLFFLKNEFSLNDVVFDNDFFCFFCFVFDNVCLFCTKFFHQINVFHNNVFVENYFFVITIRFVICRTFK